MYGDLFHDICVYSDVCNLLADHHYHIQARRYMHELFLDAPFKEVIVIIDIMIPILCRIITVFIGFFFLAIWRTCSDSWPSKSTWNIKYRLYK
jgi:hypothetical protein